MNESDSFIDRTLQLALWCWTTASGFFVAGNGILYIINGKSIFHALIKGGPFSITPLTLASVMIVWLSLGVSLALLRNRGFRASHWATVVCTLFIIFLYVNILRERTSYGDVGDYITAAEQLTSHVQIHGRYLYPPFFATVLSPFLPLGFKTVAGICWTANLISLVLFSVLLTSMLTRYGFGHRLPALLTLAFLAINVPVLRTLGYVQVNLHVANLILIALLCYPRLLILSALALALAVHLKVSPIILVLPFLLCRDWRWNAWFAVMATVLVGVTFLPYGWQPFSDFLYNIHNVYTANGLCFRENSVDSIFRCSAQLIGISLDHVLWPIMITKACILAVVLLTMTRAIKNRVFLKTDAPGDSVLNGVPVLLMFMLLASPLIWEHHPVFVALPYLLMLKRLTTPSEWVAYAFAFFLEYILPTFDFFPWSFGRLLSPLILIGLMYVTSKRTEDGSLWRFLAAARRTLHHPEVSNHDNNCSVS